MSDQTSNTKPEVSNVVSFEEKIKAKFYGNELRELPTKTQDHLYKVVSFISEYEKSKVKK